MNENNYFSDENYFLHDSSIINTLNDPLAQVLFGHDINTLKGLKLRQITFKKVLNLPRDVDDSEVFNRAFLVLGRYENKEFKTNNITDANNFLYEITFRFLKRKEKKRKEKKRKEKKRKEKYKKLLNNGDVEILYFENTYGAGHGRMKDRYKKNYERDSSADPFLLPSPYIDNGTQRIKILLMRFLQKKMKF